MTKKTPESRLENVTERLIGAFEELDFIHSLSRVLANPEELEDIDAYLRQETQSLIFSDLGWVVRMREGLEITSLDGVDQDLAAAITASFLSGDTGSTAASKKKHSSFLTDDLHKAFAKKKALPSVPESLPRAFMAAPFQYQGELLGWICLGRNEVGSPFDSRDLKMLETLAAQASLFLKNANLVQALRNKAQSLGRRLQHLERVKGGTAPDLSWIKSRSPKMRHLARQVEGTGATDATVLLLGESGTGKSLVARIVHRVSRRKGGPFVEINCGAVPANLIESELFGHKKGSFTGADRDRQGLFVEAHGGTIFLDEVGELPLDAQVKLLTVLEQRTVRPIGSNHDVAVDVRVIAATNQNLQAAIADKTFREDLYYRLNVITLTVPPLRERREEILPLARKFLDELSTETHRRVSGFTSEAEEALLAYGWPGNVRELRNVIERGLLLIPEGGPVTVDDLPFAETSSASTPVVLQGGLKESLHVLERDLLMKALEDSKGVVSEAADRLAISRTNFHNKLRKHGLIRESQWK